MTCPITVAMPVHRADAWFEAAFASIIRQSHADLEILLVLNGSDATTRDRVHAAAASDTRSRVLELEHANLAGALNVAIDSASHEFIARMDADDVSRPDRLTLQADAMSAMPEVGALGSAFETIDRDGRSVGVLTPPSDPREARWRLMLGNPFAHGSMLLRRSAVHAAGGYDPAFVRAQDYDLWLRMSVSSGVCALPEVLYTLRRGARDDALRSTEMQAEYASRAMSRAWSALARSGDTDRLASWLAPIIEHGRVADAVRSIESALNEEGPSLHGLMAWLLGNWRAPASPAAAQDVAKRARLREVGQEMRSAGVRSVWLYGAGRHTSWLCSIAHELGVSIAGVVDDHVAGTGRSFGVVQHPSDVPIGADVLLSSDWHEDRLWEASASLRERGVRVWRLYADQAEQTMDRAADRSPHAA